MWSTPSPEQVSQIINLLYTYSYFVLFPLTLIEGPVVTIIAGVLVYQKFMDFVPTFITIVVGDLIGDVLYYAAGRWWLNKTYIKVLNFFKIDLKFVAKIEKAVQKNRGKVLFFGKLSQALGGIVLFASGLTKVPMKDFLWYNFLATIPKSLILLLVGFYFGGTVSSLGKALDYTVIGLFVFTAILIAVYFVSGRFSRKYINKSEN